MSVAKEKQQQQKTNKHTKNNNNKKIKVENMIIYKFASITSPK